MARRRKGSLDFGGKRPVIVAYGMGVDSTAMLVGMAEAGVRPDLILFADTGSEKYETYAYHDVIQAYLRSVGFPPVLRVAYPGPRRGKYAGQYDSLLTDCLVKHMLPSIAYPGPGRHGCSFKYKVEPQNKYVDNWEPALRAWEGGKKCVKLIGYDAGPADARRGHKFKDDPKYDYVYPLREWGWDREKCKAVIREAGVKVPLKSACFFCTAAKPHEITWLVRNHPELADIIVKMEQQAMPNLTSTQGLWIRPTKCRPASMSEWIEYVRLMDAAGKSDELIAYSEEVSCSIEQAALGACGVHDAVGLCDECVAF